MVTVVRSASLPFYTLTGSLSVVQIQRETEVMRMCAIRTATFTFIDEVTVIIFAD